MSKNKEKHHSEDEAKKGAKEPDKPVNSVNETVQDPGSAVGFAEARAPAGQEVKPADQVSAMAEHEAKKLQKAAQEIDQLKDQLLRLRADFDNYRKRSLREKGEIYENANEALMLELLPIIDHLQLAINSAKEHKAHAAFQDGLQLIADQLMTAFAKYGLNPFNSEKQPFDANLHEAISCLPSETEPEGTILAQSRQGYRFKNKLLRPAQVVVSSGPAKPEQPETHDQPLEE